jgi:hypothetical protein
LVERLVRVQEAGGSNPLAPTKHLVGIHFITAVEGFRLSAAVSFLCTALFRARGGEVCRLDTALDQSHESEHTQSGFVLMLHGCVSIFAALAMLAAVPVPAGAQSVISTHSGVVHFFEGTVFLGDQPLESHLGRYPSVPKGAELRTANGRAEVLLTPGVFLRMKDHSAIRMVANDLADTQVELLAGSIIVESGEPNSGTSVTLIYQGWGIHLLRKGTCRIDSEPPRLWVRQGELEVFSKDDRQPVAVEAGMSLSLGDVLARDVLAPERSIGEPKDKLQDWANGRSESISADDAITAQIDEDPATVIAGVYGPIYFPVIGVPSLALDPIGLYNSVDLYQPGFSSIYLPGYTHRPLIFSLMGRGLRTYPLRPRGLTGVSAGAGIIVPIPRSPILLPPHAPLSPGAPSPVVPRPGPRPPVSAPPISRPAAVRAPVHIGGRR